MQKRNTTGKIIIKGGTIEAEGGAYWVYAYNYHGGAGIGTGLYGIGGTIEILGGRITAAGGRRQEPESEAELVEV